MLLVRSFHVSAVVAKLLLALLRSARTTAEDLRTAACISSLFTKYTV